jgi:hypothetical protein
MNKNIDKNNWGGRREGAGHPLRGLKKKNLTIKVDDEVREYLDSKGNKSAYVNNLILEDMMRSDS